MSHRRQPSSGFTLIEVMAVVALISVVFLVALNFFTDLSRASAHASNKTRDIRRATAILDRVARDFEGATLLVKPPEMDPFEHPWLFVAESRSNGPGADHLKFVTRNHDPMRSDAPGTNLAVIAYMAKKNDQNQISLYRWLSPQLPESLEKDFPRADDEGTFLVADDLWNHAGIKLEPVIISYSSFLKKVWDWKFQVIYWSWTASHFPDPEFQFHSKYAGEKQSNNLNGFESARADEIMDAYRYEFDGAKRRAMLQELDGIIFGEHPYALNWYAPYFRVLYWDRFGHPREYSAQFTSDINNIMLFWWVDSEREDRMRANRSAGRPSYPERALNQYDDTEQTYWLEHDTPMHKAGTE